MRSLGLTFIVCFAACSGGEGDPSTSSGSACDVYASAYRSYLTRCGAEISASRWSSLEPRLEAACSSALSLPGITYTESQFTACARALGEARCGVGTADLPACDFPPGTLADGAPCTTDDQCRTGHCQKSVPSGETISSPCGTCQPRLAIGADCAAGSDCVVGATCDYLTDKCIALSDVGGPCESSSHCKSGLLYCDSTSKTCKARGGEGASCTTDSACETQLDCVSGSCRQPTLAVEGQACGGATEVRCGAELNCDSATSKCVRVIRVAPGGDCSAPNTRCERGSCSSTTKKCPVVIADGGACTPGNREAICDDFASCYEGKCTLVGQAVCK